MKLHLTTLAISVLFTPYATAEDQTDSLNLDMSNNVVKVIKQYNGRWKGWSDGCINCDKPLSVRVYEKKKASKSKVKGKVGSNTVVRAPIKQGYCECNCKPFKESNNVADKEEDHSTIIPTKKAPAAPDSENEQR